MTTTTRRILTVAGLACLVVGCATSYSPSTVRKEIERQRGVDPRTSFELNLGRLTTYLLKSALQTDAGDAPFAGLKELQLAVYEIPEQDGPAIDVTRFGVRGWEPTIRAHDEQRSIMILLRASGTSAGSDDEEMIGDLVVVGAGRRKVVYGRLQGALSPELPAKLREVFSGGGPDAMVDALSALGETDG